MTYAPDQASVCAVVVTYNRKELLRECLHALLTQTYSLSRVVIVDNVSTDGTSEMLRGEFPSATCPQIEVMTLPKNVGGAGGFEAGMRVAFAKNLPWLWLMDDDSVPYPDALEQLFLARERFAPDDAPQMLGSRVIWTDGTLHPMNHQWIKLKPLEEVFRAAAAGTASFRTSTFVSLLLRRSLVERYGFPIGSYFLGGDDVEYTARITRCEFAVAVPQSVVMHKTQTPAGTLDAPPLKFYYYVRNTVWMLTRSKALEFGEALKLTARFITSLAEYLSRTNYAGRSWIAIGRGLWNGIAKPVRSPVEVK